MTKTSHYNREWLHQQGFKHEISVGYFQHGDHVLHDHDFHELVIMEEGDGFHIIESCSWPITSGDVYLIPKGIRHGYRSKNGISLRNILFTDNAILTADARIFALPGVRALLNVEPNLRCRGMEGYRLNLDTRQLQEAVSYAERIEEELTHKKSGYASLVSSMLIQLLVFLSRTFQQLDLPASSRIMEVANVLVYLETHMEKRNSLAEISEIVGMSPRTLHRHFFASFGITPAQYLRNFRIQRAKEFLSDGTASVTEIAFSCGFCDASHFSRTFHEVVKLSPREYRRLNSIERKNQDSR
jgi:AraC-like DNA-binding protein